jgi:hypothetical protein
MFEEAHTALNEGRDVIEHLSHSAPLHLVLVHFINGICPPSRHPVIYPIPAVSIL